MPGAASRAELPSKSNNCIVYGSAPMQGDWRRCANPRIHFVDGVAAVVDVSLRVVGHIGSLSMAKEPSAGAVHVGSAADCAGSAKCNGAFLC